MEMGTVRTVASIAIIVGCFAFLYPKLFHPIILKIFDLEPKQAKKETPFYPPNFHGHTPDRPHQGHRPTDDIKQHMRPGPHPGMRAHAAQGEQQNRQGRGSGKGMMGVVLPMYAVGIVVYLVYTLIKVFNKKNEPQSKEQDRYSPPREQEEPIGRVSASGLSSNKQYIPELDVDKLLPKSDERQMSEYEMDQLQKRLAETEAQMAKILQAMQTVQQKTTVAAEEVLKQQEGTEAQREGAQKRQEEELPGGQEDGKDKESPLESSAESSPDSDSYEILSKSDKESGPEDIPDKVENLTAEGTESAAQESSSKGDNQVKPEEENQEIEEEILIDTKQDSDEEESGVRKRVTHTASDES